MNTFIDCYNDYSINHIQKIYNCSYGLISFNDFKNELIIDYIMMKVNLNSLHP